MKRFYVIIFGMIISSLVVVGAVHALEFQTDPSGGAANNPVTLKFEFGSTLNITTTSDTIAISGLVPGTSDISSNGWTVTVNTNNRSGYTLSATVGCSSGEDCYDSKNLSDGTNNFSMLSSTGALTSGTWGISLDSSATKNSNFQPLAKYDETATIINQTTNATGTAATGYAGTANTTVRIGAYAASDQPAGTYTNVINFTAVANNVTPDYMQDQTAATMAKLLPYVGATAKLTDKRDEKEYTVAKLADGNYWMTQNLDHDIKTDGSVTYDSTTTDIPSAWTPSTATYATGTTTWATGTTGRTTPESYDPGDLCWDGTINENYNGTLDNETTACGNDKHMHIGNYYNWTAAVAMNDSSSYTTNNTDVNQSICPAGWRLPIGGTTNTGSKSFQYLWDQYSSSFDDYTMMNSPLYFSYAGGWYGVSEVVGSSGDYWSSVVLNSDVAYELNFGVGNGVNPQKNYFSRYYGNSIRCVLR